jgi:16S rRNA (guanine527-N7)-methyltransferase
MVQLAWDQLSERARELFGIELNRAELEAIGRYLDLICAWAGRTNLIAVRSRDEIVNRHVLDSIAPFRFVRDAAGVADFGSGAGFPAIPLAILAPATRFHLVESRRKRATFLRHVVRTLNLGNASIYEGRGEGWRPEAPIDLAIGRAVRTDLLGELSIPVLNPTGRLIVMRKRSDLECRIEGFREIDRLPYDLPGGERHQIVVFRRAPP